jgi:hypothetical protein
MYEMASRDSTLETRGRRRLATLALTLLLMAACSSDSTSDVQHGASGDAVGTPDAAEGLAEVGLDVAEASPDVSEEVSDVPEEATDVLEEAADVSEETTDVPEEVSDIPEETTDVPEETADIPEEAMDVPEETVDIPEEAMDVPEETADIPEEATDVPEETADIPEEATDVPEESADMPEETADIPEEATDVPDEAADIPEETADTSEEATDVVDPCTQPDVCDDQNPCTDDSCDPIAGCVNTNNAAECAAAFCEAGSFHAAETCSEGACPEQTAQSCDDQNPCADDSCDPIAGCVNTNNAAECAAAFCEAGSFYAAETCSAGACPEQAAQSCDDQNGCTADSCDPSTGCAHQADTSLICHEAACDDLDWYGGVHCAADGSCPDAALTLSCDDQNVCTIDACDPTSGCASEPGNEGVDCSTPIGQQGTCLAGVCAPGCVEDGDCDDGVTCTTDACDDPLGVCVFTPVDVACDDQNGCTDDTCNPATGCVYVNNTTPCAAARCEEGVFYAASSCASAVCPTQAAEDCDDQELCTDDSCDATVGCVHGENAAPCAAARCEEGVFYAAEACSGGACPVQAGQSCDDQDICTTDGCGDGVCQHVPVTGCCASAAECPGDPGVCQVWECVSGDCLTDDAPDETICTPPEAAVDACVLGGACLSGACEPVTLSAIPICDGDAASWCALGLPVTLDCAAAGQICDGGACVFDYASAWGPDVTLIEVDEQGLGGATGDLADGIQFGGGVDAEHGGAGVFKCLIGDKLWLKSQTYYAPSIAVPAKSRVTVNVTPIAGSKPGLFLIAMEGSAFSVPPTDEGAFACADDYPKTSLSAVHSIEYDNLTAGDVNVLIAVVSNKTSGAYELDVSIEPIADPCYANIGSPSDWPPTVTPLILDGDGEAHHKGALSSGLKICAGTGAFDWATGANACFVDPAPYAGYHVYHALSAPLEGKWSLSITATPDPGVDVNLVGYRIGAADFYTPPHDAILNICEASPSVVDPDANPGQAETISFVSLNANASTNIFFSVAGPSVAGGYTVDVKMTPIGSDACPEDAFGTPSSWAPELTMIDLDAAGTAQIAGDLAAGAPPCTLDWADDASVACFPSNHDVHFAGNHVLYALSDPVPPASVLHVTVTPEPGVDVSLYGYWMGTTNFYVPPFLPAVGACEASYPINIDQASNPDVPETLSFWNPGGNPYNYVLGVAGYGAEGISGGYTIDVEIIESAGSLCPESLPGATYSAWPSTVTEVTLPPGGGSVTFAGDLDDGACVDLGWAESSQVACFPATRFAYFEGPHVMYALAEPIQPHSRLTITATPRAGVDVSLYGYQIGETSHYVPPAVPVVVACEASYPIAIGIQPNPDEPETILFDNPTDHNAYNVFFAVAGPQDVLTGGYDLIVDLTVSSAWCEESLPGQSYSDWPADVTLIELDAAGTAQLAGGDLADGACMNLGFAGESQVACFPATRNQHFQGNHVFYALAEPLPPSSSVTIAVQPEPDVDVSLYGYQAGVTSYLVPPYVPSVTACEASYPIAVGFAGNPGGLEWITFYNPGDTAAYNIFFAVTGTVMAGTSGGYRVEVVQDTAEPFCAASLPGGPHTSWPTEVTLVDLDAGGAAQVTGDLSDGECVNLTFASSAQLACFPATRSAYFMGSQRYYALAEPLPPGAKATIEVIPDVGVDVSLYGYQIGPTSYHVPPYVPSAVTCEASYPITITGASNPGRREFITFNNPSSTSSYNLFFAVAGPEDTTSGGYTVIVDVDASAPWCPESTAATLTSDGWPASVTLLDTSSGAATKSGDLSAGGCVNLDFASDSAIACFPATRDAFFQGNHVFYGLSELIGPGETLTVTATPDPGVEVSLYGFLMGASSYYTPPTVPSVWLCEASHSPSLNGVANAGEPEIISLTNAGSSSYRALFAVAGDATSGTAGAYEVSVIVE